MTEFVSGNKNGHLKNKNGQKKGHKVTEKTKLKKQATEIFNRVVKAAKGEIVMTAVEIRAADLALSKTMPSLSSVEQTIMNDDDAKSMEQLKTELLALLQANPELKAILVSATSELVNENNSQQSIH